MYESELWEGEPRSQNPLSTHTENTCFTNVISIQEALPWELSAYSYTVCLELPAYSYTVCMELSTYGYTVCLELSAYGCPVFHVCQGRASCFLC